MSPAPSRPTASQEPSDQGAKWQNKCEWQTEASTGAPCNWMQRICSAVSFSPETDDTVAERGGGQRSECECACECERGPVALCWLWPASSPSSWRSISPTCRTRPLSACSQPRQAQRQQASKQAIAATDLLPVLFVRVGEDLRAEKGRVLCEERQHLGVRLAQACDQPRTQAEASLSQRPSNR